MQNIDYDFGVSYHIKILKNTKICILSKYLNLTINVPSQKENRFVL